MRFRNKQTGLVTTLQELRYANQNSYIPDVLTTSSLEYLNIEPVLDSVKPEYNILTEFLVLGEPAYIEGNWTETWQVCQHTAEYVSGNCARQLYELDNLVNTHIDAKARQNKYRDRYACMVRCGFPGPWQQECVEYSCWADNCLELFYDFCKQCEQTPEKLIGANSSFVEQLPTFTWKVLN